MPQADLFRSIDSFRATFNEGLMQLLSQCKLGPFILVCANSTFDPAIHKIIRLQLRTAYEKLKTQISQALADGRPIQEADDDLMVFLKIMAVGFDQLRITARRRVGPWEVQFNHLRSFRPGRLARKPVQGIFAPHDPNVFNFNHPLFEREVCWRGSLATKPVTLLYNKYPFVDLHGILVPDPELGNPQFLGADYHEYLWAVTEQLGSALPGVGFGYNSYGAYASINHMHFQMFVQSEGLPVQAQHWIHNGGSRAYPVPCHVFDSARRSWGYIARLHESQQPYNLLYAPGRLYCFPRKPQGTYRQPSWTTGFTWYELSGGMITFNRNQYESLTASEIACNLADLTPV